MAYLAQPYSSLIPAVPQVSPTTGDYVLNSGTTDDAAALSALITAGARRIILGAGTFTWKSSCVLGFDGIHIQGLGPSATIIRVDDSGGNIGDAFKVNSVLDCSIKGMTITATSVRSAGSAIKVLGKNHITASPVEKTQQCVVEDVNLDSQFNGVVINDSAGGEGAWGCHFSRMQVTGTAAGGVAFWINTPNGGQQYIYNIKMYNASGVADASRPLAGVRYQGGADVELLNVTEVYFRHGLMIDPPSGQAANVMIATACDWDNNTMSSVHIAPQAGGTVLGVELNGGWGYTPTATGNACVQIDGGQSIEINGGKYWSNFQAVRISGPAKHVTVADIDASGSATGVYATSSASDFKICDITCGIIGGVTPTIGIQVDAGCDHYTITGNNVRECTTKITNTPGTAANQRIVQDNVIA